MPITSVFEKQSAGMTLISQVRDGAVILLSGGIDSTVVAYLARKSLGTAGRLFALSVQYGQRHSKEIQFAHRTSRDLGFEEHYNCELSLGFLNSSLVGQGDIPTKEEEGIPSTWVPQRNSIFLALAFAYAETVGVNRVYIGVNSVDYSGYPDCRPEFIGAIGKALNLASKKFVETGRSISIPTPLQHKSKVDIIKLGLGLRVDFSKTLSCYKGGDLACGRCPSCLIRLKAFEEVGVPDPIGYERR